MRTAHVVRPSLATRAGVATALAVFCLGAACRDVTEPGSAGDAGRVVWTVAGKGWAVQPAVDSTTAYFGSFDHEVIAVDKATGRERWRRSTGIEGLFTYGYNVVLAPGVAIMGDGYVFAFDRATGAPRWTFQSPIGDTPGFGRLASDGVTVYAGTPEGRVYAINGATGTEKWRTDLTGPGVQTFLGAPALKDGVLYVGASHRQERTPQGFERTGTFSALDATTGRTLWARDFTREAPGSYAGFEGAAAFHGVNVIVSIEDGRVFALRRATGEIVWVAPRLQQLPPSGPLNDYRPLAVGGDVVVVGSSDGIVVGLNATTGRELWRNATFPYTVEAGIATDEVAAYVGHSSAMRVYDFRTGRVRWESLGLQGTGGYWAPPAIDGDRLYVSSKAGFHALRR